MLGLGDKIKYYNILTQCLDINLAMILQGMTFVGNLMSPMPANESFKMGQYVWLNPKTHEAFREFQSPQTCLDSELFKIYLRMRTMTESVSFLIAMSDI